MHINDLPIELLRRLFRYAIEGFSYRRQDPSGRREIIQKVCFWWTDILDADTLAWTFVFVDNYTPLINLHCWLVKSGTAPLSFEIQVVDCDIPRQGQTPSVDMSEYMGWLIPTISPFLARCHCLHLVTTTGTASTILLNHFNRLRLPLLHRLTIDVTPIPMSLQRLPGLG